MMRLADQFVAAVFRHLDELLVDRDDVALLVGLRHDAGDVHDVGAHLELGFELLDPLVQLGSAEEPGQPGGAW